MALTPVTTIQLIPFPSLIQTKSLEPDGVAVAYHTATSDGSGGNHLLEIRAPSSHLYVLKNFSVEADGVSLPGQAELLLRATWAQDAAPVTQQHFYTALQFVQIVGLTNRFLLTAGIVHQIMTGYRNLILGSFKVKASAVNPIAAISVENINLQVLTWTLQFWAYRREVFTVPGTLETMTRGLVR